MLLANWLLPFQLPGPFPFTRVDLSILLGVLLWVSHRSTLLFLIVKEQGFKAISLELSLVGPSFNPANIFIKGGSKY
jgi:hypothetical protein